MSSHAHPSTEEITHLEDDKISLDFTRQPGCRVTCKIHARPEFTAECYEKAIQAVRKEVAIPGFRKGKAPLAIITKNYSDAIKREWHNLLGQEMVRHSIHLSKIYPWNPREPKIQLTEFHAPSPKESATATATYEFSPELRPIDPTTLSLATDNFDYDQRIGTVLETAQLSQATWTSITDRPATEGDRVFLKIQIREQDTTTSLFLKKGVLVDWLYDLLNGATLGQTFEGQGNLAPLLYTSLAGMIPNAALNCLEEEPYTFTVTSIEHAELPSLDNPDFLANFEAESEQHLRTELRKMLEASLHQLTYTDHKDALIERIMSLNADKEIPHSLYENECVGRLKYQERLLNTMGTISKEEWEKQLPAIKEAISQEVKRDLTLFLVLQDYLNQIHQYPQREEMEQYWKDTTNDPVSIFTFNTLSEVHPNFSLYLLSQMVLTKGLWCLYHELRQRQSHHATSVLHAHSHSHKEGESCATCEAEKNT